MEKILITGAGGTIGQAVTKYLQTDYQLTIVDTDLSKFNQNELNNVIFIEKDLDQADVFLSLLEGIDYVIHLAGNPDNKAEFEELIEPNFYIPHYLFKAAANATQLKRIVYASSIHASGNYPSDMQVKVSDTPRPTGYYGASKLFMEAIANYYAYEHGVQSIGIRIGNYLEDIDSYEWGGTVEELAQILTAEDFNQLISCCLQADLHEPAIVVNGLSNHTFPRLDLESARHQLGYQPSYNAFEAFFNIDKDNK